MLDDKVLRTPGRQPLELPNELMAVMVALEWDAQVNKRTGIQPATMPLTVIAFTAIDTVLPDNSDAVATCLRFLPTDSALFLTSAEDRLLLKKQRQYLVPVVKWFNKTFQLDVKCTESFTSKISHPEGTIKKVEKIIRSMNHFELACLQSATMECKSIVLALAMLCR